MYRPSERIDLIKGGLVVGLALAVSGCNYTPQNTLEGKAIKIDSEGRPLVTAHQDGRTIILTALKAEDLDDSQEYVREFCGDFSIQFPIIPGFDRSSRILELRNTNSGCLGKERR